MIKFLNESVRQEFHLLPADRQQEIQDSAERFAKKNLILTVLCVERITDKISEVAVRIDQQFNSSRAPIE